MDINATPYFLVREPAEFAHRSARFGWDARRGAFVMLQTQSLRLPGLAAAAALAAWADAAPLVQDPFGQLGRIAADGARIEFNAGRGFETLRDESLLPVTAADPEHPADPEPRFTDLALGGDGRLVAAYSNRTDSQATGTQEGDRHGLVLFHLGRRWQTHLAPGLPAAPVRAIVDRDQLVWCVTATQLILCAGEPLPLPYLPLPTRFEPLETNPHPFTQVWGEALPAGWAPLALCADARQVYCLAQAADGSGAQQVLTRARDRTPDAPWTAWPLAPGIPFVVDLAVLADGRLVAPAPREPADLRFERRDCPVLDLIRDPETGDTSARLVGERFPLRSQRSLRLVSALDGQVRYQGDPDPAAPGMDPLAMDPRPRELHPLPRPVYPVLAEVTLMLGPGGTGLDSGRPDTPWHRLYIDGCIPSGCRLTVFARAYNDPAGRDGRRFERQSAPLWSPLASELPFHAGFAPSRRGESGLFEVLLQHESGAVRTLSGRYLQLRLRMEGDGRHTPAIHALRIYAPRFSYQEAYLPEFFRQQAERADDPATPLPTAIPVPANGADVRERLLAAFEGVLTPIEGRIAAAEALLHPDCAPAALLPPLAGALGIGLPPDWPEERRRRQLAQGCLLQQWRGTYPGLRLALDIATGGAVERGQVVVVENFRLRRTFATILGLDLDDRDHPLTLGTGMSGNSIVGDSLILSDEDNRVVLSLLAPELAAGDDAQAVAAFFDRYSHRVSILLHGAARRDRALVEATLVRELPAHLEWLIIETDHPFVLGLAPLLEVDTFLEETPAPKRVTLDDTWLGREGLLTNPIALSPRDAND